MRARTHTRAAARRDVHFDFPTVVSAGGRQRGALLPLLTAQKCPACIICSADRLAQCPDLALPASKEAVRPQTWRGDAPVRRRCGLRWPAVVWRADGGLCPPWRCRDWSRAPSQHSMQQKSAASRHRADFHCKRRLSGRFPVPQGSNNSGPALRVSRARALGRGCEATPPWSPDAGGS